MEQSSHGSVRSRPIRKAAHARRHFAVTMTLVGCALAAWAPSVSADVDATHPADTPATAYGPVDAGSVITASLVSPNDSDYFLVVPTANGQPITVTIKNTSPPADSPNGVRAQVEDADGADLAPWSSWTDDAGPGESVGVTWKLEAAGTAYLVEAVFAPGWSQHPPAGYVLKIASPLPFAHQTTQLPSDDPTLRPDPPDPTVPPITPIPPKANCVVPRLGGATLATASRRLRSAHCLLGRVTRKNHRGPAGRVLLQSRKAGRILGANAAIGLTLSRRARHASRAIVAVSTNRSVVGDGFRVAGAADRAAMARIARRVGLRRPSAYLVTTHASGAGITFGVVCGLGGPNRQAPGIAPMRRSAANHKWRSYDAVSGALQTYGLACDTRGARRR